MPLRAVFHFDDNVYDLFYQVKYLINKSVRPYKKIVIVDINEPISEPGKAVDTFERLLNAIVLKGQPEVVGIDLFVDIAPYYIKTNESVVEKYPDCPCKNLEYPAEAEFSCFLDSLARQAQAIIVLNTKFDILGYRKNQLYYPLKCVKENNICETGVLQNVGDRDGIHRRYFTYATSKKNEKVCSFGQTVACNVKGYENKLCQKVCDKSELIKSTFSTGDVKGIMPELRGPSGMYNYVNAAEVFNKRDNNKYLESLFKNKIVLVSTTLFRYKSLLETPYSRFNRQSSSKHLSFMPYIEFQANAIESLLKGKEYKEVPVYINIVFAAVLLFLIMTVMFKMTFVRGILTAAALILLSFAAAFTFFYYSSFVMNIMTAVVVGIVIIPMVFGYRYLTVSHLFGKYVSSEVLYLLWQKKDDMILSGEKRFITVMFTDIRGFTTLSEKTPPEELLGLLNDYFEKMSAIIENNQGYLNKFIGDGLMIIFGAPLEKDGQKKSALYALKTADEMIKEIHKLNEIWKEKYGISGIEIGAGIHSGEAIVGNIGSSKRLEYSAIGDTINLAARLESANKEFKTNILMSEDTYELIKDSFECKELGETKVKGRDKSVKVYTLE